MPSDRSFICTGLFRLAFPSVAKPRVAGDQADEKRRGGRGSRDLEGNLAAVHVRDDDTRNLVVAEMVIPDLSST